MLKKMLALILIFVAGGAWLYLDCLTRQEKNSAALLQKGIVQARAEAQKRADIKANFEQKTLAVLTNCQSAADKSNTDYMALVEQAAPHKHGAVVMSQAIIDAAANILASAKAGCQQVYDSSMKSGY